MRLLPGWIIYLLSRRGYVYPSCPLIWVKRTRSLAVEYQGRVYATTYHLDLSKNKPVLCLPDKRMLYVLDSEGEWIALFRKDKHLATRFFDKPWASRDWLYSPKKLPLDKKYKILRYPFSDEHWKLLDRKDLLTDPTLLLSGTPLRYFPNFMAFRPEHYYRKLLGRITNAPNEIAEAWKRHLISLLPEMEKKGKWWSELVTLIILELM